MLVNMVTSKLSSITGELFIARGTMPSFVLNIFTGSARKFLLAILFVSSLTANATAQTNQASPLGTNLIELTYYAGDQPFLNIFKTGGGWAGNVTSGARYDQSQNVFQLDVNGYPTSMNGIGIAAGQTFTEIDTLVLRDLGLTGKSAPFYRAGRYVVLYDGQGTLTYNYDAAKNNSYSAPGRDVLDVTPSAGGIRDQHYGDGSTTYRQLHTEHSSRVRADGYKHNN